MEATELRIGNYFKHNSEWSYREEHANTTLRWNETDWYALGECTICLENIESIPLTEDWVIKFDLEKREVLTEDPYREYSIRNNFDIYCYMDKSGNCLIYGECVIGEDFFITKCDTVHDFQNTFKILTGKELKLDGTT